MTTSASTLPTIRPAHTAADTQPHAAGSTSATSSTLTTGNAALPRVCIVGPGAIGGWLGTRLAHSGVARVSALARGQTLQALRTHGWRMQQGDALLQGAVHVSDQAAELGPQDVVFIAVKGPALLQVAQAIAPLIGPDTLIVPAMNGMPWWFCDSLRPALGEAMTERLQAVLDPSGQLRQLLPQAQVLGCAVHVSANTPEPGLVSHTAGNRLVLGEPDGAAQARTHALADLLTRAGMDIKLTDHVRQLIWTKLLSNLTMNPISALTASNTAQILDDGPCRELALTVMQEAVAISERLQCAEPGLVLEERLRVSRQAGPIRTSMLQDLDAGRPLELEGIVGTVVQLAKALAQPCPSLAALYALCGLLGERRGLYQRPAPMAQPA